MKIKQFVTGWWQRSMLHRAMLVSPFVVLLLLAGFWKFDTRGNVRYFTAKAERGDIVQVVQATGTINAVTTVQVGSQVSGRIAEIYVDFNSKVKKDQIIAKIDPSLFQTRLLQAEADLQNALANVRGIEASIETQRADVRAAEANLDRARAQFREAELNLNRTKELFEQGIVAASQYDTVKATYDAAAANVRVLEAQLEQAKARLRQTEAQLEQAKASVAQRRANVETARVDLSNTIIRAPIDGTVIARNVDVGQTVAASLQAPTLFIIAQDLTKMLVYAKTDEADVGKIQPGAMATFRVDSFPNEIFRGRVSQVRMNATVVQNVVTYDTIIEFENRDQKLFPGMTAYVTIPIAQALDVVKIPNGALRFHQQLPEEERTELLRKYGFQEEAERGRRLAAATKRGTFGGGGGQPPSGGAPGANANMNMWRRMAASGGADRPREQWAFVWKLLPNNQLQPIRVKVGITDYTFTELKEGEIQPGDELVIGRSTPGATPNRAEPGPTTTPGFFRRM
jgi:HlyD family secretion protein